MLDFAPAGGNGLYQVQPNATLIGIAVGQTQYAYVNASGIAPAVPADADQLGGMFRTAFAGDETDLSCLPHVPVRGRHPAELDGRVSSGS